MPSPADDGVAQQAARALEQFGINATDNSVPGKAAVLRTGEAVDAVNSAIHSANAEIPLESAGYLICSIVQLGGILYGTLVVVGALVLLSLYPLCNCCGRFFLDLLCFSAGAVQRNAALETGGDDGNVKVKPVPERLPVLKGYRGQDLSQDNQEEDGDDRQAEFERFHNEAHHSHDHPATMARAGGNAPPQGFFAGIVNAMGSASNFATRGGLPSRWGRLSPPDSPEEQGNAELSGLLTSRGRGYGRVVLSPSDHAS